MDLPKAYRQLLVGLLITLALTAVAYLDSHAATIVGTGATAAGLVTVIHAVDAILEKILSAANTGAVEAVVNPTSTPTPPAN